MSRIDGRYASVASDIRLVMGAGTYAHADAKWRGTNTNDDVSALDVLMAKSGGVRVSAHVPDVASARQNVIVRRGTNKDMTVASWQGITIIPDEVTKAAMRSRLWSRPSCCTRSRFFAKTASTNSRLSTA